MRSQGFREPTGSLERATQMPPHPGKAPFVKAAAGIRYLGIHLTTPASVSDATTTRLHECLGYVLDWGCQRRIEKEMFGAEHADHAVVRLHTPAIATLISNADLRGSDSSRHETP